MLLGKTVLGLSGLVFTSYGLVSLFSPAIPAGFAGLSMNNGDAFAEIGAMYGGLQFGLGMFCFVSLLKSEFYRAGLLLLAIGIGSLAVARFLSLLITTDPVTAYTYGATIYEFATASAATAAILKKVK